MSANFHDLAGQTITAITAITESGAGLLEITTETKRYSIIHHQNCCEHVHLNKTIGDPELLYGHSATLAEEDSPGDPDWYGGDLGESHTWSKFILEAGGNRVEFWFLGESNGYYGEGVDFEEISK